MNKIGKEIIEKDKKSFKELFAPYQGKAKFHAPVTDPETDE
jgi:hypothetical protein